MPSTSLHIAYLLAFSSLTTTLSFAADKPALKATTEKITIDAPFGKSTLLELPLIQLPPGKITLKDADGKEKEHDIKPIWIGKTEVTWDQFDPYWLVMDVPEKERSREKQIRIGLPEDAPDRGWGHEGSPAGSISFKGVQKYCEWLSKMTKHHYRLPTEAEWEYACRAGGGPVNLDKAELEKSAWHKGNSDEQTQPVAQKKPNDWGLYDMLGNVAEWVICMNGKEAVAGGSYLDDAAGIHSTSRAAYSPDWQRSDPQEPKDKYWYTNGGHIGFRVVRDD